MRLLTLLAYHIDVIDRHLRRISCPALVMRRATLLERVAEERAIARASRPNIVDHLCATPEEYPFCNCFFDDRRATA